MAYQNVAKTITIRNTSNNPILIDVKTRKKNSIFHTGSGVVKILPNRSFEIEESRVDLGLIENYIQLGQIQTTRNQVVLDDTEPPGNFTITPNSSYTSIQLTWDHPVNGPAPYAYQIEKKINDGEWTLLTETTETTYTDSISSGTSYYYRFKSLSNSRVTPISTQSNTITYKNRPPVTILGNKCLIWSETSNPDNYTLTGGFVTALNDLTENGYDFNTFNGNISPTSLGEYNGIQGQSGSYLITSNTPVISPPFTFWVIAASINNDHYVAGVADENVSNEWVMLQANGLGAGDPLRAVTYDGTIRLATTTSGYTQNQLYAGRVNAIGNATSNDWYVTINNAGQGQNLTNSTINSLTRWGIGAVPASTVTGTTWDRFIFFEIIVTAGDETTEENDAIHAYLSAKWGIL